MDTTIMRAYFQGRLGVVELKGKIYDLSGFAKWVIVKDLRDAGLIEETKSGDTTLYCLYKRDDGGEIIYASRRYTQIPNEAIVLSQDILDPCTIEGHRVLNNPQVMHMKSIQALGSLYYNGLRYDLDLPDDVKTLGETLVREGLIEYRETSNVPHYGLSPRVHVLDPRFSKLNHLNHMVILTFLVNIKPFYQDKGEN